MMPAGLSQPPSKQASTAQAAADPPPCPVLNLTLAPIHLNLLGLVIDLGGGPNANQVITLNITAIPSNSPGGGLLGQLLCGLSNALSQPGPCGGTLLGQLSTQLQALQTTLNSIFVLVGGL